jgi:hypothetical protein
MCCWSAEEVAPQDDRQQLFAVAVGSRHSRTEMTCWCQRVVVERPAMDLLGPIMCRKYRMREVRCWAIPLRNAMVRW